MRTAPESPLHRGAQDGRPLGPWHPAGCRGHRTPARATSPGTACRPSARVVQHGTDGDNRTSCSWSERLPDDEGHAVDAQTDASGHLGEGSVRLEGLHDVRVAERCSAVSLKHGPRLLRILSLVVHWGLDDLQQQQAGCI